MEIDHARADALEEILMRKRGYGLRYDIMSKEPDVTWDLTRWQKCGMADCHRMMPVTGDARSRCAVCVARHRWHGGKRKKVDA